MPSNGTPTAGRDDTTAVSLARVPTPLGDLNLAATADALIYCGFQPLDEVRGRLARSGLREVDDPERRAVLETTSAQLDAYLQGRIRSFTVPVDLRLATPFSRRTVSRLDALVPYGSTATYGALARALDRPRAARAVGAALGANPLCVVLPCHRIVGSTGALTGYAGGVDAKKYLLALETRERLGADANAPAEAPPTPGPRVSRRPRCA
ncbi:methylated-DNA--[protein]-cysteine S-methyltransferase [Streptomyces spiramenti]|uniref:Methylated-DNA--[protein]-cysteine S-methyltransferase n=1 Tax=Streptomyces spiramenti TaxID=2720606 RepID=A0ABX1AMJ4_9ACTN|nr:methylated-DNA--[protein]-cysteine S-methyltransferase [Streptomyces spiramenti]NJP65510.1 methylated-DNA--[protein]-cysteine S-methyltransferase [Streptomyces spiramenti]